MQNKTNSEHDNWADVQCHKSRAKTKNSPKLSHEPPRTSKLCRQDINFWLIRSHVSQSSETNCDESIIMAYLLKILWIHVQEG